MPPGGGDELRAEVRRQPLGDGECDDPKPDPLAAGRLPEESTPPEALEALLAHFRRRW